MDIAHSYAEKAEMDARESGVRESTEHLTLQIDKAAKIADALKERLTPLRVNIPRAIPGEGTVKDDSPPRSEHAAELGKLAGRVATLGATLNDMLDTLDI